MTTDHESTDKKSNDTEADIIERIRELVGPAPEGELMSEQLIRHRREEAAREEASYREKS